MTSTSKTMTTFLPLAGRRVFAPGQAVGSVLGRVKHRWTSWRNRRHLSHLYELDDYLLRDLGLERRDISAALHHSGNEDPTRLLNVLADARLRLELSRNIT